MEGGHAAPGRDRFGLGRRGVSEPVGRWLLDPVDQDVSCAGSRRIGRTDVDAVWSMCTAFADADRRMGGEHARRTLIRYADDAVAPLLTGTYTEQIGRELFAAVARLCDIAGFMCFDSDDQGLGQKYFITALRMAKTSGDEALGAHILTDMSMQAQHQRHAHEAVTLADAGVAAATRSGSASALARSHAVRARALAMRGDASDSEHALNQAERALDRTGPRDEPFWVAFFTPQQLAAEAMYTAAEPAAQGSYDATRQTPSAPRVACSVAMSWLPRRSRRLTCPPKTPQKPTPPQTSNRPAMCRVARCQSSAAWPAQGPTVWSPPSAVVSTTTRKCQAFRNWNEI